MSAGIKVVLRSALLVSACLGVGSLVAPDAPAALSMTTTFNPAAGGVSGLASAESSSDPILASGARQTVAGGCLAYAVSVEVLSQQQEVVIRASVINTCYPAQDLAAMAELWIDGERVAVQPLDAADQAVLVATLPVHLLMEHAACIHLQGSSQQPGGGAIGSGLWSVNDCRSISF